MSNMLTVFLLHGHRSPCWMVTWAQRYSSGAALAAIRTCAVMNGRSTAHYFLNQDIGSDAPLAGGAPQATLITRGCTLSASHAVFFLYDWLLSWQAPPCAAALVTWGCNSAATIVTVKLCWCCENPFFAQPPLVCFAVNFTLHTMNSDPPCGGKQLLEVWNVTPSVGTGRVRRTTLLLLVVTYFLWQFGVQLPSPPTHENKSNQRLAPHDVAGPLRK